MALALLAVVARPLPAAALDCAKASLPIEKMLCSTPELKKANDDMSAAYFKLLRETTDPDFHALLIRSQQRWLEQRLLGPQRYGLAEDDKTDDREIVLAWTLSRLDNLRSGRLISAMQEQRNLASRDGGGPFAGYTAHCSFVPPPYGGWGYECWSSMYRQHHARICSVDQMWASGHMTDYRRVSVVDNGKPKTIAGCLIGYGMSEDMACPDPAQTLELKPLARWSADPDAKIQFVPQVSDAKDLWKYDPDLGRWQYEQRWMDDCLFAPVFPPPESSRPDPTP